VAIDYDEIDRELDEKMPSKYVFLPKVGDEATYEIVEVAKMEHPKLNITFDQEQILAGKAVKVKQELGFYLGCVLKSGQILVVNSFGGYRLFRESNITDGHKICVKHPARGEWNIDILEEPA
jgi:hypothetical protein